MNSNKTSQEAYLSISMQASSPPITDATNVCFARTDDACDLALYVRHHGLVFSPFVIIRLIVNVWIGTIGSGQLGFAAFQHHIVIPARVLPLQREQAGDAAAYVYPECGYHERELDF